MSDQQSQPLPDETRLSREARAITGVEPYRTSISVRQHSLTADEPKTLGGGDAGPTPFDLVCSALASCTTITVRMYADRKGWPLERIEARVEHARVPAGDTGARVDRFTLSVEFAGDLDEAQRSRLLEIAGRCPVHRLLVAGAIVETRG